MWGCMWGKRCTTHNNTTTPLRAITDLDVMEQAFASGQSHQRHKGEPTKTLRKLDGSQSERRQWAGGKEDKGWSRAPVSSSCCCCCFGCWCCWYCCCYSSNRSCCRAMHYYVILPFLRIICHFVFQWRSRLFEKEILQWLNLQEDVPEIYGRTWGAGRYSRGNRHL